MIKEFYEEAVSPVVGVMLMLVVTIIIAAVVSGFAGGMIDSQGVAPQATIKGSFSLTDGLAIRHTGGDPLPMHDLNIIMWDGPTFGEDVEIISKQVVNMSLFRNAEDEQIYYENNGTYTVNSFKAGESIYIKVDNCTPELLQPDIMPSDYEHDDGKFYTTVDSPDPDEDALRWSMCLFNNDNIGNVFYISLSDDSGNSIAQTSVVVTA
ncbi:type IV pilin N-terminal domain-containing protein [Methanolacinia paynteri]|uniref:type IV pilin N-terminal domain-containing protein n=1 Tax=Methanolacinia paynteri TaxID=230356 RepID=UPI000A078405|nr:type IV pilin N-terminal domain-containing protein [Methanolacinia paynteri]